MNDISRRLRKILTRSENRADCLVFSGGLDTSILAYLFPKLLAITVSLEEYGEDIKYAKSLAKRLNLNYHHKIVKIEEAIESIPEVIGILKSFDPAIPNDIAIYFGLKTAKGLGFSEVMTGDGSDEIFAGYSYMESMENLKDYIKRISLLMKFNSNVIGQFLDVNIIQPYLDKKLLDFALTIPIKYKLRKENGALWGKWILRKAFEGDLPSEIIWQRKRPIEYGSGMTGLRRIISSKIKDEEFERKSKEHSIRFLNKEHLYYYKIYRDVVGEIPKPKDGEKMCNCCGAGMREGSFHCRICGGINK